MNRREALRLLLAGTVVTAGGIELLDFLKPRKAYSFGNVYPYDHIAYVYDRYGLGSHKFDNITHFGGLPYLPVFDTL